MFNYYLPHLPDLGADDVQAEEQGAYHTIRAGGRSADDGVCGHG